MSKLSRKKFSVTAGVLVVLSMLFTTCDMPLGMGPPIDFEPPVLTITGWRASEMSPIVPITTPMYVRQGAKIFGTVTDNVGVDRVEVRDAATQELYATTQELNITSSLPGVRAILINDNWEITLDFDEDQNGEKLSLEIVAFDRADNSGDVSIVTITIIIDIRPPVTEDMWIQRSSTRTAFLEPLNDLLNLVFIDPAAERRVIDTRALERIANVNRFQNGMFNFLGTVKEEETRISILYLNIYDAERDIDTPLVKLQREEDSSAFSPRWVVDEAVILAAGEERWPGYTAAYENGEPYFFRVAIEAFDRSLNEGTTIIEDEGFFVMWQDADIPKGNLDPIVGTVITRGGTIPVEFFDDDQLLYAYAGLLTYEQWHGLTDVAPGYRIQGISDSEKLDWLTTRLRANLPVYNWRYCSERTHNDTSQPIIDLVDGRSLDERLIYIQTGNNETDYGAFVLFSLVADRKLDPHTNTGPLDTNRTRAVGRSWNIDVIDENVPLIVFDVENGCPEENTFPTLTDGEFFTIKGYTLRENRNELNGVVRFRMAWIPAGKEGGADSYIQQVQTALRANNYPESFTGNANLSGVQHWDFVFSNVDTPGFDISTGTITYNSDDNEIIGENTFRSQPFERRFSVLGNTVDPETGWRDFHYRCAPDRCVLDENGLPVCRENETKLFVLYAECNMGHQVFRQMRLLGNRTPPNLFVYDVSGKILTTQMPQEIPNLNQYGGTVSDAYYADLRTYNKRADVYSLLRGVSIGSSGNFLLQPWDRAIPFQMYTRDSILKYWVRATPNGDLSVRDIRMRDITFENQEKEVGSGYNAVDQALTFVELYPDETQRVFLFEAVDSLGNIARLQRTVAVTNAARLESITTTTQSGSYGIGTEIILQANFSGQIRVEPGSGGSRPELNIRVGVGSSAIQSLPAYIGIYDPADPGYHTDFDQPSLFLRFRYVVPEGAQGQLITIYEGLGGNSAVHTDRPIRLFAASGTIPRIIDVLRDQHAFVPGYTIGNVSMPNWTTVKGSLQDPDTGKDITVDGIRPVIQSVSVGGKTHRDINGERHFYFRDGEVINLTVRANGDIRPSDGVDPVLRYTVSDLSGNFLSENTTAFTYSRPGANRSEMVFSLPVNEINLPPAGQITSISITGAGSINNDVGNAAIPPANFLSLAGNNRIFIKRTIPAAPAVQLTSIPPDINVDVSLEEAADYYNQNLTMTIASSAGDFAEWEDYIEYSFDGGLNWHEYTVAVDLPNGRNIIHARYVDRAGNLGEVSDREIEIEANFPRLLGINARQPNGTYIRGDRVDIELGFADAVRVGASGVTITLQDFSTTTSTPGVIGTTYMMTLTATATPNDALSSTVTFSWVGDTAPNPFIDKDMLNGLKITAINLSGLTDKFGNAGPASAKVEDTSITFEESNNGSTVEYKVEYNLKGIIVSTIIPTIRSREPQNAQGRSGNITVFTDDPAQPPAGNAVARGSISNDNRTIRLTFNKPMQKGNGTITIRPHGNYAIPAVFENEGYYVGIDANGQIIVDTQGFEIRHSSAAPNRTWVAGLADIFDNVDNSDKQTLIGSTSMSAPAVSLRTGLSVGPYLRTTHGLTRGMGFTGNYGNPDSQINATIDLPGNNAPGPRNHAEASSGNNFMIPDLATRWVLRYDISDNFGVGNSATNNTTVNNIRTVLDNAKFRWQEIAVTSDNVVINETLGTTTVVINLPEPLLPGLQWRVHYNQGTFTDVAGNPAEGIDRGAYWFWSNGVQRPVIRVDRKSYDARAGADLTGAWNKTGWAYNAIGFNGAITDFNRIHYTITSETPDARIFYGTQNGRNFPSANIAMERRIGSVTGAWTGQVTTESIPNIVNTSTITWQGPTSSAPQSIGQWVRPNLIHRHSFNGEYQLMLDIRDVNQTVGGLANNDNALGGRFYGFRSFNKDATFTELDALDRTSGNAVGPITQYFEYEAYEASKNYVVAEARVDHANTDNWTGFTGNNNVNVSPKGFEGVFRTVVMLNMTSRTGDNAPSDETPIILFGTNAINGIPTVAAFPLKDGVDQSDSRFGKFYFRDSNRYYWVSSEMVTQWFIQNFGRGTGGSYTRMGDTNDWITAGYGDLTYTLDIQAWGGGN